MYSKYFKRIIDFVLSFFLIIITSPLLIIVAILVKIKLGSPILFKQRRPGLNEKIFVLYKFRTMTDEKDKNGNLLSDEIRLTSFGKKLRALSLDELPQLFNVLKGDMSIIGPRPLLAGYLKLYTDEQKRRHNVRPGLSGLAQVKGRNSISWEEKFKYDIEYVDKISLKMDFKIVFNTILIIILKKGITDNKNVTMEVFKGSDKI